MLAVICVVGIVLSQAAIALFIAKFIQTGKGPRMMRAVKKVREPHPKTPEPAPVLAPQLVPARAAIDNYADLAALLEALSPTPKEKIPLLDREEVAPEVALEPGMPKAERTSGRG